MTGKIAPPERKTSGRKRWLIGLLTAGVVLAGSGVLVVTVVLPPPPPPGPPLCEGAEFGVYKVDDNCVGVTDGSYVFHRELADVQRLIAEENARVRKEDPSYVTVALLDPFTSPVVLPAGAIRHRLEGVYTALRRVNHTTVAGNTTPQIQLVLASEGSTPGQSQHVINQLVEMSRRDNNPLVAVIGLGVSTAATQQRAQDLSKHGIPMVSAYLTADKLDYRHIGGLIRMSPSNHHYIEALRGYVENPESPDLKSAVMVRDFNSENGVDLFTETLEENIKQRMGDLLKFPTQQYTGTGIPNEEVDPHLFDSVTANICAAVGNGLDTVFFAGREIDLEPFLKALEQRPCPPESSLTIMTGGLDLGAILEEWEQRLRDANLTIVVASTVHAEGWGHQDVPGIPEFYQEFLSAFEEPDFVPDVEEPGFDSGHLKGANAIMMHDALLAAARAVRLAAPEGSQSHPTAGDVHAQLLNLNGNYAVRGAGGTVAFSDNSSGYPAGKPVPVLQYPLPADSQSRQVEPLYRVPEE
ncbi:MAG: ABC transporter substrate-binding protein [Pseudonocardiaceae bacterium]